MTTEDTIVTAQKATVTAEETTDRWRTLRRAALLVTALGVMGAVSAALLHYGYTETGTARVIAPVGIVGGLAAAIAALTGTKPVQRLALMLVAWLCVGVSASVFWLAFP